MNTTRTNPTTEFERQFLSYFIINNKGYEFPKNAVKEGLTYWDEKGLLQKESDILWRLIHQSGEVRLHNLELQKAVEAVRSISRIYYDFHNNGGCNVVEERWDEWQIGHYYAKLVKNCEEFLDKNLESLILNLGGRDILPNYLLNDLESFVDEIVFKAWNVYNDVMVSTQLKD